MCRLSFTPEPAVVPPSAPAADCSPAQQAELRYLAAVEALLEDAREHRYTVVLVDVLTWYLARIGSACGMASVGDITLKMIL